MYPRLEPRAWTLREYARMAEIGLVPAPETELVDGRVVTRRERAPVRWTFDEYLALARSGILAREEKVELLDGEVVRMSPSGNRHAAVVTWLTEMLSEHVRGTGLVRVQTTLRLDAHNAPEPDLAVLRYRDDYYIEGGAGPADVLLLVEVSETSGPYDRGTKAALYARYGIPELWLVDVRRRRVGVYLAPLDGRYTEVEELAGREGWHSPALGVRLRADHVLGPAR